VLPPRYFTDRHEQARRQAMTPETFWIIKIIFGACAVLFGLLAAVFKFYDTAKDDKYDDTRTWFKAKWEAIKDSRWLSLPEHAINWVLQSRSLLGKRLYKLADEGPGSKLVNVVFTGLAVLCITGAWLVLGIYWAVFALLIEVPILLFIFRENLIYKLPDWLSAGGLMASIVGGGIITTICWVLVVLRLSIYYAAPAMLLIFPLYWFSLALPAKGISIFLDKDDRVGDSVFLFLLGIALGFTTTFIALLIGHIADPQAYVPQTFQMLASNIVFDGFTMMVTFAILSWAMKRTGVLRIPVAIFLDLLAAAVLACASLYFGLVFTAHALSFKSLMHILVARSLDGARFELSPYFWAMHTTFLPTFFYLGLVLLCWLAKLLLSVVKAFFGKGHTHSHPFKLTAALCGLVATFFTALAFAADAGQQYAEQHSKQQTPPTASARQ
jgi:hypothetical protein